MATEPLFIRVAVAAEVMDRVDPRTVLRGIEQGLIPAVRIGRMIRIPVRGFAEAVGIDPELLLARLAERDNTPPLSVVRPEGGAAA